MPERMPGRDFISPIRFALTLLRFRRSDFPCEALRFCNLFDRCQGGVPVSWRDLLRTSPIKLLASGVIAGAVLLTAGIGGYHASGSPQVCGACHSMDHVYSRWQVSLHKQFACIECHLPDTNIAGKVAYKARAGLNDLYHETLRTYPAGISISAEGREIANGNCLRCHFSTVQNTPMGAGGADCLKCHRYSVHQRGLEKGGGIIIGQP